MSKGKVLYMISNNVLEFIELMGETHNCLLTTGTTGYDRGCTIMGYREPSVPSLAKGRTPVS